MATASSPIRSANISGTWRLETSVGSAQHRYDVELQQKGDSLTGTGRNGDTQAPIALTGTISGSRVTLAFSDGDTRGKLVLLREDDGTLRGRFSNGAESAGVAEAKRLN